MNKPVLLINACVRSDSRTMRLAAELLKRLDRPYEEVTLHTLAFPRFDEAYLQKRDHLFSSGQLDDPSFALAHQFAAAEDIVIAAPYWDLSFPAALKQYLECINAVGITFRYTSEGIPEGLCKAQRIFYVTTAGGPSVPQEYGYGYVKALAENYYGIHAVRLIEASGLDIYGADAEAILQNALQQIHTMPL